MIHQGRGDCGSEEMMVQTWGNVVRFWRFFGGTAVKISWGTGYIMRKKGGVRDYWKVLVMKSLSMEMGKTKQNGC